MKRLKIYRWYGLDSADRPCQGTGLSVSRSALEHDLLRQGTAVYQITLDSRFQLIYWSPADLILFFRQLSMLLGAGLTLAITLQLFSQGQQRYHWRLLSQLIQETLATGRGLSTTLALWPQVFSKMIVAVISVGEATGQLDRSCLQVAQLLERQWILRKKIRQSLSYPLITLLLLVVITAGLVVVVIPEFEQIYQSINRPLPLMTQIILACSTYLTQTLPYLFLLLALSLGAAMQVEKHHPRWRLARHRLLIKLPALGQLWQSSCLSLLFSSLASSQQAGLTLLQGLTLAENLFSSPLWQRHLKAVSEDLNRGEMLSTAISHYAEFPALTLQLVQAAEESGQLEPVFHQLAAWYQQQVNEQHQRLITLLEPLMLIISGSLVATIVIGLYLPIFYLGDALG